MTPVRRARVLSLVLSVLVVLGITPGADASPGSDSLRSAVVNELRASTAGAMSVAVDVDGVGRFEIDGHRALPPASTQKLYTAAAALLELGPEKRLVTEVRRTGSVNVVDSTLNGDLVLAGGGDPALSSEQLQAMANRVAQAGIKTVTGALHVDDTRYDRARRAGAWKWHWVPAESAPLSALILDRNRWRNDSGYLDDPVTPIAGRFREALFHAGVAVHGPDVLGPAEAPITGIVTNHQSTTLFELVRHMLKTSDNFFAEVILKELGATVGTGGYTDGGLNGVWSVASRFGLGPLQSGDGSGLSMHNLASAHHELEWLRHVDQLTPVGDELRASLPVACVDGTLVRRFCRPGAAGRIWAKTGTLPGTVSLSGYAVTASNRRVTFAFLLHGVEYTNNARLAIDRAVDRLVDYAG
jgi:serine-type D-Ala-D-Ala carboxypeptidase/endopeptidase (penicillin-binding protein 4)